MTDPVIQFWNSQPIAPATIEPAEMEARASLLARRVKRRDAMEYAAGAIVVAAFGWIGYKSADTLTAIACCLTIIGTLIVMRNLWVRRPHDRPDALGQASHLRYRDELVRQRDSLASVWRWYLGPFSPGLALFMFAVWRLSAQALGVQQATTGLLPALLPTLAILAAIHWLNRAAARRLTREIAALDSDLEPTDYSQEGDRP